MLFMVLNDFSYDEVQELLGEFGIEVSLFRQIFEPGNLVRFAIRIGRGKVVLGFEFPHSLRVFKAFAQCIDEYSIEPVDAGAVAFQDFRSAGDGVGHQAAFPVKQRTR
jgi:hypothetical protein